MSPARRLTAILVVVAVHVGCGEDIQAPPETAFVRVTPDSARLVSIGETLRLTATAHDPAGNTIDGAFFTWSSSVAGAVTVDPSGNVTAVSEGTSLITATSAGKSGATTVLVEQEVAHVAVSPTDTTLTALGDTLRLTVVVSDDNDHQISSTSVSWSSSDSSVLTVSVDGLARSDGNGSASVVVTAADVADTAAIHVSQVAAHLTFEVQPENVLEREVFTPPIQVAVRDPNGHMVTTTAPAVTLDLVTTGTVPLSGLTNVSPAGGLATFDSVWVEDAGAGFTLRAGAAGVADVFSGAFDVNESDLLYVVNNTGSVQVLHVGGQDIVHTIPVGRAPLAITLSPDQSRVYVANAASNTISVIETSSHTVIATVAVGESPRGLGITPDGTHLYVSHGQIYCCPSRSMVMVIETATNTVVDTVNVPRGAQDVTVHPAGLFAYVASWSADSVAVVDVATNTVTDAVVVLKAERIAFSPRDSMAYVTGNAIWTIDPDGHQLSDYVALPSEAIVFLPSGDDLFVGHALGSPFVSRIETAGNTIVAQINVGDRYVFGVAASGDGRLAYVSHDNSGGVVGPGSVSVIDVSTNEIIAVIPAGDRPRGIVALRGN